MKQRFTEGQSVHRHIVQEKTSQIVGLFFVGETLENLIIYAQSG